jgi:hypothetical protein
MARDPLRILRELARRRGDQVTSGRDAAGLLAALDPTRTLAPQRRASLTRLAALLTRFEATLEAPDESTQPSRDPSEE